MKAPRYRLLAPPMIDPRWLSRVQHTPKMSAVDERGVVVLAGEDLRFEGEALPVGSLVRVSLSPSGFFEAVEASALAKEEGAVQEALDAFSASRRTTQNGIRAAAEAANAEIRLPVKWDVGIKDVLSGLTENSDGSGRNSRTVEHIILLEPLEFGRLVRDENDFLCSTTKADNGKRWSNQVSDLWVDGDGNSFQPPVTCKKCLEIAHRITLAMAEQDEALPAPKARGPKL